MLLGQAILGNNHWQSPALLPLAGASRRFFAVLRQKSRDRDTAASFIDAAYPKEVFF
jgi:hypothetical protein